MQIVFTCISLQNQTKKIQTFIYKLFFFICLVIDVFFSWINYWQLVPVFLPYFAVKVLKSVLSLDQEIITLYKSVMLKEIVALLMCTFDFSKKSKIQKHLYDSDFCYFVVVQGKYFKLYISDMVRLKEIKKYFCNLDTYELRFLYC